MSKIVITVIGKDKSGIVADVTGVLYKENANLEDLSMTNLEGEFVMVMIVDLKSASPLAKIKKHLNKIARDKELVLGFNLLTRRLSPATKRKINVSRYLISVVGKDQTGLVHKTCHVLSVHKLNITDLNTKILAPEKKNKIYVLMLEVDIPKSFKLSKLDAAWEKMKKDLDVDVQVKKVETIEF
jgi:glycine cleavage system transcriptional repressor